MKEVNSPKSFLQILLFRCKVFREDENKLKKINFIFCNLKVMKLQVGEWLISNAGEYYRVVEYQQDMVSLMRMNGYTLFSCSLPFVQTTFRPASPAIHSFSRASRAA